VVLHDNTRFDYWKQQCSSLTDGKQHAEFNPAIYTAAEGYEQVDHKHLA